MKKNKLKKIATIAGIITVLAMFIIKVIAFSYSGSVSVLASLIDSGADFFTTIITTVAVFTAVKPADKNHRFGHGKAESVGALLQGVFIFISAFFLIWQAIHHMVTGYKTQIDSITFVIMIISLMLTLSLVFFQRYVIKKTKSIAIKADNVNYTGDIFTTIGVIVSLIITKYTQVHHVDSIFGIAIALYLCKNAKFLIKTSLDILMDREISSTLKNQVKKEIRNTPDVFGYHNFRSRSCSQTNFIEFHIELDENISFKEAERISRELKDKIKTMHDNMDITIHPNIYRGEK